MHALLASTELLSLRGISKSFGETEVLTDVSVTLSQGRILGLAGENGAGKSTLLRIAAGLEEQDAGQVWVRGEQRTAAGYGEALTRGLSMVFQEQALLPNMTVYENVFVGFASRFTRRGVLRHARMRREARELLDEFGLGHLVRADRPLAEYDFGHRQLVEIVRAFAVSRLADIEHPIILLDEATAALNDEERSILMDLIGRVRGQAALVFVSHLLGELLEVSDDVLVLKDGREVTSRLASELTEAQLHQLITGRDRPEAFYIEERQRGSAGEVALRAESIALDGRFSALSLEARQGEILGIAGVVGSGKEAVGRVLAGLESPTDGRLHVAGGSGAIGYVPKERKEEGVILNQSLLWNSTLAGLPRGQLQSRGVLRLREERRWAASMLERLDVRPRDLARETGLLSGGNQQKVVIGRWTLTSPRVLVLDNPTRGVDVGSRYGIYRLLRDLCDEGLSVVLISDDLLEVIGLSDRIVAMRDRRIVGELPAPFGRKPTEHELVAHLV